MRKALRALTFSTGLLLLTGVASASVVFTGSADGQFSNGSATLGGLTYSGSTFSGTTSASGFLGIGDAPGTPNVNNLGSFTLDPLVYNYSGSGQTFSLNVTFTSPVGTVPSPDTFSANLLGQVSAGPTGGVTIFFDTTPHTYTFNGGTFTFSVNPAALLADTKGGSTTIAVSGQILAVTGAPIPEPASLALLGGGLALLGLAGRRSRRAA